MGGRSFDPAAARRLFYIFVSVSKAE